MIRPALFTALTACLAAPALAQTAPDPSLAYGCDYELAFEAATAPLAELMGAQFTTIDAMTQTFEVGNYNVALRNPRVAFVAEAKVGEGQSADVLEATVDLHLRTRGGPSDEFEQAWISSVAEVSFPIAIELATDESGAPVFQPDLSNAQMQPILNAAGEDPIVAHFAKFEPLGGEDANTAAALFVTLFNAMLSTQKLDPIALPIELPGAGQAPWTLDVSAGGDRMLLIRSDNPGACASTYGSGPAGDYLALSMPPSQLNGLLSAEVAGVMAAQGPPINDFIIETLQDEGVQNIAGLQMVDTNPALNLIPGGFAARIATIPNVTTAPEWAGHPDIGPDCDIAVTLNGAIDVSFQLALEAGEFVSARATPLVSLSFVDAAFSNCWGIDDAQEWIWEGAVDDKAADKVAAGAASATASAAVEVRAAEAAIEDAFNGLIESINATQGLLFSPQDAIIGDTGLGLVGRFRASNAVVQYAEYALTGASSAAPVSGLSLKGHLTAGVTCAPLIDCPDYDPRTLTAPITGSGYASKMAGTMADAVGAPKGSSYAGDLVPGDVLNTSGATVLIRQQGTHTQDFSGAHRAWPGVKVARVYPKPWPFSIAPQWLAFEWVIPRPEVSLSFTAEATDYDSTVSTVTMPMDSKGGVTIESSTTEVKTPTEYTLSLVIAPDPGGYDAAFVIDSLTYEGGNILKVLEHSFVEPYDANGDNTYVVHLEGHWAHADGDVEPISMSATVTLDGVVKTTTARTSRQLVILEVTDRLFGSIPLERVSARTLGNPRRTDPSPIRVFAGLDQRVFIRGRIPSDARVILGRRALDSRLIARDVLEVHVPADAVDALRLRGDHAQATNIAVIDRYGRSVGTLPAIAHPAASYDVLPVERKRALDPLRR